MTATLIEEEASMKRSVWLLGVALAVGIGLVGCSKKGGVNTGKLESSFQTAEPAAKSDVDKAVSAIKARNYSDAMTTLQRVASKAKLTPEQQQAIKDTIAAIQKQ